MEQLINKLGNSVAKVEIAHYKQILLLPPSFEKTSAAEMSESICMWEKVNKTVTFENNSRNRHTLVTMNLTLLIIIFHNTDLLYVGNDHYLTCLFSTLTFLMLNLISR